MKNSSINFYIEKFSISSVENMDLSGLPMLVKRKLSELDKVSYSALKNIMDDNVEEIVFGSRYGEMERLKSIIESYLEFNEASPAKFSASVHNYFAGFFCQLNGLTIPYHSISAYENTFSMGLIKSIISEKSKVLYCCGDSSPICQSIACLISKSENENSIKCTFTKANIESEVDEYGTFDKFLRGEVSVFKTPCGIIERVN